LAYFAKSLRSLREKKHLIQPHFTIIENMNRFNLRRSTPSIDQGK